MFGLASQRMRAEFGRERAQLELLAAVVQSPSWYGVLASCLEAIAAEMTLPMCRVGNH